MKELVTVDKLKKEILFSSYHIPKVFFTDPKYIAMKMESKLAYMLMLNLTQQSVTNNWIDENNHAYVVFPRKDMMDKLNIKGTQKAAGIIKELVSKDLLAPILCYNTIKE